MSRPHRPAKPSGAAGAEPIASLLAAGLLLATTLIATGCGREPSLSQASRQATDQREIAESANSPANRPMSPSDSSDPSTSPEQGAAESISGNSPEPPNPVLPSESAAQDSELAPSDHAEAESTAPTIDTKSAIDTKPAIDMKVDSLQPTEAEAIGEFRLLLPTTAGLLLVDLDIRIGEQSLSQAFEQQIQSVMEQAGDSDSLTWNELLDYIKANPQRFGPAQFDSQQYRNMIPMYDRNRNMRPDPDEVANFLFRDTGSAGPFRLAGSNFFRQTNRTQSPMFLAIDRNGNHSLDAEEIQLAYQSLLGLDRNGDRRIDVAEVLPPTRLNNLGNDAWSNRNTSRWGDVAMDLGGYVDWSMVSYSLDEASRQSVFHAGPNAIARLDQDGDASINRDESRGLLDVPADLHLRLQFAASNGSDPQIEVGAFEKDPQVTVESAGSETTRTETTRTADRLRIASDRFQLIATVRDLRRNADSIPREAFDALDANNDGGLEQTEIPAGALREYSFDDLDKDEDGKLTHRELIEGMNPIAPIWSVQVRSRGAETPDAVFAWLDQDQNGLLSTRELLGCSERLQDLASNQDELRATDIPDTFLIQFGRGDPQQDTALFAVTPSLQKENTTWPRWATSMDSNQDGDISRAEFLGETQQFDRMDQNGDGFLSGGEIE